MEPMFIIAVCAVIATLTFVVVSVYTVQLLQQVRLTAGAAERSLNRTPPLIDAIESAVSDTQPTMGEVRQLAQALRSNKPPAPAAQMDIQS